MTTLHCLPTPTLMLGRTMLGWGISTPSWTAHLKLPWGRTTWRRWLQLDWCLRSRLATQPQVEGPPKVLRSVEVGPVVVWRELRRARR